MYADIAFNLKKNTNTKDLELLTEEDAIRNAIRNILQTKRGELAIYDPKFGAKIESMLFEKITPFNAFIIETEIRFALENYEPRIELTNITVNALEDSKEFEVFIEYNIISLNSSGSTQLTLGLK